MPVAQGILLTNEECQLILQWHNFAFGFEVGGGRVKPNMADAKLYATIREFLEVGEAPVPLETQAESQRRHIDEIRQDLQIVLDYTKGPVAAVQIRHAVATTEAMVKLLEVLSANG